MHQVVIVGAGQLGRRHLQGLVKSRQALSIHIVDPSEAARSAVDEFVGSSEVALPPIQVHSGFDALPRELSLAIVATTANQRLHAVEQLARAANTRHLVLEKFLFNNSDEYERASRLFDEHGMIAWVNTPRRHFSVYRGIRENTQHDRLLQFTVDGGDWGLCCNSVHFVDLAQFLAGTAELRHLSSHFDDEVLKSKRDGYVELTGEIRGEIGSAQFCVRSIRGSTKPITVTLHYEQQTIFVAEGSGTLWRIGQGPVEATAFRLPYQSEMTGLIADQLLSTGSCDLTPYADSAAAHLPLLRAFAQRAGQTDGSSSRCAIT
ncbi:MAG: Gfo/Idh/MocA family oxidoreductase [Burkholderiales bacterium]|nr:Gfo/Idh/MocA family oxidoreductase [Burkholderiales bacterium]